MNRKLSIQLVSLFFVLLLTACTSSKKNPVPAGCAALETAGHREPIRSEDSQR